MRAPPPVTSNQIRLECRYGEEITADTLLQELKDKKAAKYAKVKGHDKKEERSNKSMFISYN